MVKIQESVDTGKEQICTTTDRLLPPKSKTQYLCKITTVNRHDAISREERHSQDLEVRSWGCRRIQPVVHIAGGDAEI